MKINEKLHCKREFQLSWSYCSLQGLVCSYFCPVLTVVVYLAIYGKAGYRRTKNENQSANTKRNLAHNGTQQRRTNKDNSSERRLQISVSAQLSLTTLFT